MKREGRKPVANETADHTPSRDGLRRISALDRQIIGILSRNPQIPNRHMAEELGVSEITVASKIESLIVDGVIKLTVQKDIRTSGYAVVGTVEIFVRGTSVQNVAEALGEMPEAIAVTITVDDPQIIALFAAKDLPHFNHLVEHDIGLIDGVARADTSVFMDMLFIRPGIGQL
ncbi:Lrp/AsnC family transcriptional regulator [Brevundimonas sp.]|uniref:Lrp/AsnC family transcriptional regulator n=1 Tax=Brevundimonas sp. TaxID=1871086 RepID=UPI001A19CEFA|nr:Lrp/AsnC family transcriptional regulator [Brevundimonas sp.]MBJ7483882.1 Lrp/AsnC family transcriptional regulator [Brevundimonas sp.]